MLKDMELWTAIRRALFVDKMSKREAARHFDVGYHTIAKISRNERPGVYKRARPPVTKITPFIPFIEGYLAEDKLLPRKQKHTRKNAFSNGYSKSTAILTVIVPSARP